MDGVLVTNEVVDEVMWEGKHLFLFKVNYEKTYDLMNWKYLMGDDGENEVPNKVEETDL